LNRLNKQFKLAIVINNVVKTPLPGIRQDQRLLRAAEIIHGLPRALPRREGTHEEINLKNKTTTIKIHEQTRQTRRLTHRRREKTAQPPSGRTGTVLQNRNIKIENAAHSKR
jgi:hypothetical protein